MQYSEQKKAVQKSQNQTWSRLSSILKLCVLNRVLDVDIRGVKRILGYLGRQIFPRENFLGAPGKFLDAPPIFSLLLGRAFYAMKKLVPREYRGTRSRSNTWGAKGRCISAEKYHPFVRPWLHT